MRVIAGEAGGRNLKSGKGTKARPTTDLVKGAIFNTLADRVLDAKFLDLFAGFGGVGIEALSRGAERVIFVEQDPKHLVIIKENLALTRLAERAEVLRGDALKVLPSLKQQFDLIFVDPPYEAGLYEKVLESILTNSLLAENGVLILEHHTELPPQISEEYEVIKSKTYGETTLIYLWLKR